MKKINQGNSKKNPKKAAIATTALAVFFPLLTGVIFFIFLSKTNQDENKKLALANSSAPPSLAKHEVVGDLGGFLCVFHLTLPNMLNMKAIQGGVASE
ncbi:hypothetical protein UNDYM_3438 [Undibacterium sp. YM2]|uniref:hypothetical protein n=1 Tax=Undibacterium sp. YM2 TaxID=2058625 RepID=UPI001331E11F|nr:hypothetical protein [Undibacterium sp. YM2]BBB67691.1 hypothetical protein UNDYM_3438 [Undibacterium sp. YM2]